LRVKLVAVSRVRNEIDIIEPFVRHHAACFDKIIVLDDGSSDGTYEALQALQATGLPLVLLREPSVGYEQSRYMSRLAHMAADQFGADWIAPLDADEFIETPADTTLAQWLAEQPPRLLTMPWNNFLWRAQDDDDPEPNPVLRQNLRLPPQTRDGLTKIIIPAGLLAGGVVEIAQGNHHLLRDGSPLPAQLLSQINLCHFPIRSVPQYASKIGVGYLQYAAMAHWDRQLGWHYVQPFRDLAAGLTPFSRTMEAEALRYSVETGEPVGEAVDLPLRYLGGPLTLTVGRQNPLTSLLACAEAIALERARLAEENIALHAEARRSREVAEASLRRAQDDLDAMKVERFAMAGQIKRAGEDNRYFERRQAGLEMELVMASERLYAQAAALSSRSVRLAQRLQRPFAKAGLAAAAIGDRLAFRRRP
jgi:hypothetical protein